VRLIYKLHNLFGLQRIIRKN
ncbi:hypothetical protein CP8484711_1991, partial [Chlamydia psittaci 84-8471/1]